MQMMGGKKNCIFLFDDLLLCQQEFLIAIHINSIMHINKFERLILDIRYLLVAVQFEYHTTTKNILYILTRKTFCGQK